MKKPEESIMAQNLSEELLTNIILFCILQDILMKEEENRNSGELLL
ncbi:MAG: hypothetical protein AABX28_02740 [Nanoarchaeota archaeon]